MGITAVRRVLLTGPCTNDPILREARKLRSAAFIEVITDGRHTGLGETYAGNFCPEAVPAIVEFFNHILIGQNVDDISELWRLMYQCAACRTASLVPPQRWNGLDFLVISMPLTSATEGLIG
ncbi:MAG: hypothetical protein EXS33_00020 [Pedosphaera sp.]|nr:hypothetical protein [Pedosphaera sp.]